MAQTLTFNPAGQRAVDRLPFVDPNDACGYTRFWAVSATGGAFGGFRTGRALGMLYLKHLREHPDEEGATLAGIVRGMFLSFYCEGGEEEYCRPDPSRGFQSIDAQVLGFFSVLEERLRQAAPAMSDLDRYPAETLLVAANEGLAHSDPPSDGSRRSR